MHLDLQIPPHSYNLINRWSPHGILKHIELLLENKHCALICVAEGAGQVSDPKKSYLVLLLLFAFIGSLFLVVSL
jgi:hypothetical protein